MYLALMLAQVKAFIDTAFVLVHPFVVEDLEAAWTRLRTNGNAETTKKKTQRRVPFWGPNFVPQNGGPEYIPSYDGPHGPNFGPQNGVHRVTRGDVFGAARFPKTVAVSKSAGFIGMLGCACDPFICPSHWWMRPGSQSCELGRTSAARPKREPFSEPKKGNLIISKKPVAPRPALQPSLSLFLSKAWLYGAWLSIVETCFSW